MQITVYFGDRMNSVFLFCFGLESVAHDGAFGIHQELVFCIFAVINTGDFRTLIQVSNKRKSVHSFLATLSLRSELEEFVILVGVLLTVDFEMSFRFSSTLKLL